MGDTQESIFQEVGTAPPDPIFGVLARFKDDKSPQKVNLSIGGMKCRFITHNMSSATLKTSSYILGSLAQLLATLLK